MRTTCSLLDLARAFASRSNEAPSRDPERAPREEFHRHGSPICRCVRHDEAHAAAAERPIDPIFPAKMVRAGAPAATTIWRRTDRDSSTDEQPRGEDRATMITA